MGRQRNTMKSKVRNIKTKRQKKAHEMTHHEKVAFAADASKGMTKKVLRGDRNSATKLGQRIVIADVLIQEKESALLQEIKRVLPL